MIKNKEQLGFTLVEVLLVVTVFTIILSSAISLTTRQVLENDLASKALAVADLIEKARNNSATGYFGDVWSIKVLDNDALCMDSGDCILLFKGRGFSGRDASYDRFVEFDPDTTGVYIESNQENEFYFDYQSGWLATTTASSLEQQDIVLKNNAGEQKSVLVSPSGTVSIFTCGEDKVYDVSGYGYNTVKIATQCWMAENLNTGSMLASAATDPTDNDIVEKWCNGDSISNCSSTGGLYNWDEMMTYVTTEGTQGICPNAWHLPSDSEMDILEANYSPVSDGAILKIGGTSGFDIVIGNEMNTDTNSYDDATIGALWTSTDNNSFPTEAYVHYVTTASNTVDETSNAQGFGFSVRCLKDY